MPHPAQPDDTFSPVVSEEDRPPSGQLEDIWGLCLSGGGYRAMLLHLGVLWRLNEAGYLRRLDALVVTHEHWDHISGFLQAEEIFNQLKVSEVWLAWTENPKDDLAKELGKRKARALRAIMAAARAEGRAWRDSDPDRDRGAGHGTRSGKRRSLDAGGTRRPGKATKLPLVDLYCLTVLLERNGKKMGAIVFGDKVKIRGRDRIQSSLERR